MKMEGLTLIEAHETGKKYRVVGSNFGYGRYVGKNFVVTENGQEHPAWILTIDAACAMYELEPQDKLLTREDVYKITHSHINSWYGIDAEYVAEKIVKVLFDKDE